jgi:hypothetical protein
VPEFDSEAAFRDWVKAVCTSTTQYASDGIAAVKRMLDPNNAMEMDCRVKKHPDCCVLCRLNDDCDKIPLHVRCRCTPEMYFKFEDTP